MRDNFETADSCPIGRVENTVVAWRYDGAGRRTIDVTQAENLWGRIISDASPVPFPWLQSFAVLWSMPRDGYIAAAFDVPEAVDLATWGKFTHGETLPGPATDMAISRWCGDFNPPEPGCSFRGTTTGQAMSVYKRIGAIVNVACVVEPGETYYVNVRVTDPEVVNGQCTASTCRTTIQHNHTP
ncbi:MAG TPA: hypothetical protein VFS55_06165 [Dokdonella sp.]|nr:hypothetical protein [Dokdonella sp.]